MAGVEFRVRRIFRYPALVWVKRPGSADPETGPECVVAVEAHAVDGCGAAPTASGPVLLVAHVGVRRSSPPMNAAMHRVLHDTAPAAGPGCRSSSTPVRHPVASVQGPCPRNTPGLSAICAPDPIRIAPEIAGAHAPICADLLLDRHVPRLHSRRVDVGIHRAEAAKPDERRLGPPETMRVGIATRRVRYGSSTARRTGRSRSSGCRTAGRRS